LKLVSIIAFAAVIFTASTAPAQQFEFCNNFLQNLSFVTGTDRGREQNLDDNFTWMQQQGYTHLRFFGIFANRYYSFPSTTLQANGYPTNSFFTSVLEPLVQAADQHGITVNFDGWEVIAEANYDTAAAGVGYITVPELSDIVQDVLSLGVNLISEEQFGGGYIQTIQATTSQAGATHETTAGLWWQYDYANLIADEQLGNAFSFYPYDQAEVDSVISTGSQSYPANLGLLHVIVESAKHYGFPTSIAVGSFGTFESHNWKNVMLFTQIIHAPNRFSVEESDTDMLIWTPGFNFMDYVGNEVVSYADQSIGDRPIANLVVDLSPLYSGSYYPTWHALLLNASAIVNTYASMGYDVVASVDSVIDEADAYFVLLAGGSDYTNVAELPDYVMPLLDGSKPVFIQPTYGIPDDNDASSWIPLQEYFGLPSGDTQSLSDAIPATVQYDGKTVLWGGIWLYLTPIVEQLPVSQIDTSAAKVALSGDVSSDDVALIIRRGNKFLINSNLIHLGAAYVLSDLIGGPINSPALADIVITEDKAMIFAEHDTDIDIDLPWNGQTHMVRHDDYGNIVADADTVLAGKFAAALSQGELVMLFKNVTFLCGDADAGGSINVADAVYLINYIFKGGPAPDPLDAGDADCDGAVNVGDAVHLINYIFKGGPQPCCP
jgi:hypothetical protein